VNSARIGPFHTGKGPLVVARGGGAADEPTPDAKLNRPEDVARTVLFALQQPSGCEVRDLVVCPSVESSWP
jgi:NADP-dependent 3-hydroxy acid dehydrogenase YdfG